MEVGTAADGAADAGAEVLLGDDDDLDLLDLGLLELEGQLLADLDVGRGQDLARAGIDDLGGGDAAG